MKIKEIIIEGFKSYSRRTVLTEFDFKFNAITGFNGSGKSNILDAICFCIGLTSYKMARAKKVQDLIYKSGQAGITEASVTIVFNNSDKSRSPQAYKELDLISVTRKIVKKADCKSFYYINGSSQTNTQVKSMFKSIGLNIDTPETFFVGQGKITKIVSFRPQDLRDMMYEAAGIAYYNEVSIKSAKVLDKTSQANTNNIQRIQSVLGPQLDKLKREKEMLTEFNRCQQDLKFVEKESQILEYDDLENSKKILENQEQLLIKEYKDITLSLQDLMKKKEKLMQENHRNQSMDQGLDDKLVELETLLKDIIKQNEVLNSQRSTLEVELQHEQKQLKTEENTFGNMKEKNTSNIKNQIDKVTNLIQKMEGSREKLVTEIQETKDTLEGLKLSRGHDDSASQCMSHLKSQLRALEVKRKEFIERRSTKERQINKIDKRINGHALNEHKFASEGAEITSEIQTIREKIQKLKPQVIYHFIQY